MDRKFNVWHCVLSDLSRSLNANAGVWRAFRRYIANPGFKAVVRYRFAHYFFVNGFKALATIITARTVARTGAEITPSARFGPGLVIKHPVGIVVGRGVWAGQNCTLLQGVTLGEKYSEEGGHEYPTLGDGVTICSGAAVLGRVHVGDNALVGANSVVVHDVPKNSRVAGAPATEVRAQSILTGKMAR